MQTSSFLLHNPLDRAIKQDVRIFVIDFYWDICKINVYDAGGYVCTQETPPTCRMMSGINKSIAFWWQIIRDLLRGCSHTRIGALRMAHILRILLAHPRNSPPTFALLDLQLRACVCSGLDKRLPIAKGRALSDKLDVKEARPIQIKSNFMN